MDEESLFNIGVSAVVGSGSAVSLISILEICSKQAMRKGYEEHVILRAEYIKIR